MHRRGRHRPDQAFFGTDAKKMLFKGGADVPRTVFWPQYPAARGLRDAYQFGEAGESPGRAILSRLARTFFVKNVASTRSRVRHCIRFSAPFSHANRRHHTDWVSSGGHGCHVLRGYNSQTRGAACNPRPSRGPCDTVAFSLKNTLNYLKT